MVHWNLRGRKEFHSRNKTRNEMYLMSLQIGLKNLCEIATNKAEIGRLDESWCNTLGLQIAEIRRVEGREPWI